MMLPSRKICNSLIVEWQAAGSGLFTERVDTDKVSSGFVYGGCL
jgi:hypothetical protein